MSTTHTEVTFTADELTHVAAALASYASGLDVDDRRFDGIMSALDKVNAARLVAGCW